jgi:hypothetical protein
MNTEKTAMRPAPDPTPALGRAAAGPEMEQARQDFHRLLSRATAADLRRPSEGTRWTNEQLLFHMLFGYLVVRALLVLVRIFSLLPDVTSKTFAGLLDSARTPFHLINYLGSCAGARVIPPQRMPAMLDHIIAALQGHRWMPGWPTVMAGSRGLWCCTGWATCTPEHYSCVPAYPNIIWSVAAWLP